MGYHTAFELSIINSEISISDVFSQLSENEFSGLGYAIDQDGCCIDNVNWFDHEEDMTALSLKFPDIVFMLYGDGEDRDDKWVKYFKNGKIQACYGQIVYDEYDESKLTFPVLN